MGVTVATKCLSEHMTALGGFSYQLVTISLRLIAEMLTLVANGLPLLGTHDYMRLSLGEE